MHSTPIVAWVALAMCVLAVGVQALTPTKIVLTTLTPSTVQCSSATGQTGTQVSAQATIYTLDGPNGNIVTTVADGSSTGAVSINYGSGASPVSSSGNPSGGKVPAAPATVSWTTTGTKTITGTFLPTSGGVYGNALGNPGTVTTTGSVTVVAAPTAIDTTNVPLTALTTLTYTPSVRVHRVTPDTAIINVAVTFTLFDASGAQVGTQTVNTVAGGVATAAPFTVTPAMAGQSSIVISSAKPSGSCLNQPDTVTINIQVTPIGVANIAAPAVNAICSVASTTAVTFTDAAAHALAGLSGVTWTGPSGNPNMCSTLSPVDQFGNPTTDANGALTCLYNTDDIVADAGTYTITYPGADGERLPSSATGTVNVRRACTQLTQNSQNSAKYVLGQPFPQYTVTLTLNEGTVTSPVGANQVVNLLDGTAIVATALTNAQGVATLFFSPTTNGVHALTASYDGTASCYKPITLSLGNVNVYNPVILEFTPVTVTSVCVPADASFSGGPVLKTNLRKSLSSGPDVPAGIAVSMSYGVQSFAAGNPVTTGTSASLSVRSGFATGFNQLTTTASISATTAESLFLATVTGVTGQGIAAVPSGILRITQATSSLVITNTVTTTTVGAIPTFSATLTRTDAPAGPLSGRTVVFELTAPDTTVTVLNAVTNAAGVASVTFGAYPVVGAFFISAHYDATVFPYPSETKLLPCESAVTATGANIQVNSNIKVVLAQPAAGSCGSAVTFSATVTANNAPVTGVPLTVSINAAGGLWSCDATTGTSGASAGVATCNILFDQAFVGSVQAVATVAAASGFGAATSAPVSVSVATVTSSLAALSVTSSTVYVGDAYVVTSKLTKQGGAGLAGSVKFTLSGPTGASTDDVFMATSDATGAVTATFQLQSRGTFTVRASFDGDSCRTGASTAAVGFTIYQKVVLVANAQTGICGDSTTLTCSLYHTPQGPTVPAKDGMSVPVTITAGTSPLTATPTTSAGVASVVRVFSPPATYSFTCSFTNPTGEFYRSTTGATSVTSTGAITINFIATALTPLALPGPFTTSNTVPMSTKLTLTTPPPGATPRTPPLNENVVFTLTNPSGGKSTQNDATDATGLATTTFPSQTIRGTYTFTAAYSSKVCYASAPTITSSVAYYQRAKITLTQDSGTCANSFDFGGNLNLVPTGSNLGNQNVRLTFSGAIPDVTVTTGNGNGKYSYSAVIPNAGAYLVAATFSNPTDFYTNNVGAVPPAPEVASYTLVVDAAATSLTQPVVSSTVIYITNSLTAYSVLRRTVSPSGNIAGVSVSFVLTRLSDNTVVATLSANTDSNGKASVTFPGTVLSVVSQYSVVASYAGTACLAAVSTAPTVVTMNQKTTLTMNAMNGICGDNTVVSAILKDSPVTPVGAPVNGLSVVFKSGSKSCTGVTDSTGLAKCNIGFTVSGAQTVTATFAGSGIYESSSASGTAQVSLANTALAFTTTVSAVVGQTAQHAILARGQPANFAAQLTYNGSPVVGRTVTFTIGTWYQQSCTDVTDSTGTAACATANLYQQLGPLTPISISYGGDSCYVTSSTSAVALVFAYPAFGAFTTGDAVAPTADRVFLANTDQAWFAANPMSGSTQIDDNFRGYGDDLRGANGRSVAYPVCGGYMNSGQWDHLTLPQALPEYLGVMKSSTAFYDPKTGSGGNTGVTNDCSSNPCYYGTCKNNYGGGYYCDCPLTRHGLRCERSGYDSPGYPRGNGKGNGLFFHGNCNPSDTTVNTASIIVLKITYGDYCNGKTDRPNDGHLDGDDGHDDHHGNPDDGDHHDDDEDDDQRRKGDHRSSNMNTFWDFLQALLGLFNHNQKPAPTQWPSQLIQSQCNAAKELKGKGKFLATYCP